jgi:hypothetical protein
MMPPLVIPRLHLITDGQAQGLEPWTPCPNNPESCYQEDSQV